MSIARRLPLALSVLCCAALAASVSGAREPRSGIQRSGSSHREVTRTGPNGGTRSKHVHAERTATGYTRDTTFTDAQGRTATRAAEVVNDRDAGTRTKTVEWTGKLAPNAPAE
jgi:hypothetical protein